MSWTHPTQVYSIEKFSVQKSEHIFKELGTAILRQQMSADHNFGAYRSNAPLFHMTLVMYFFPESVGRATD